MISFFLLLLVKLSYGQSKKDDLLKTEKLRFKAMQEKDSSLLKKVLSEELIYTHSNGVKDTRQSLIASIMNGQLEYQSIDIEQMDAETDGNWWHGKAQGWLSRDHIGVLPFGLDRTEKIFILSLSIQQRR